MLDELTTDEGFFGKAGSLHAIPEETGEDGQDGQDGEAPAEDAADAEAPEIKFQYSTLKEYMLTTFKDMQTRMTKQMEQHESHLASTSTKFDSVDKRVDVDLDAVIQELKLQADDMGQRLYNVQMEQIKPLREQNTNQENQIKELQSQLAELGIVPEVDV